MEHRLLLLISCRRRTTVGDTRRDRSGTLSLKRFPNDVAPWPTTHLHGCSYFAVNVRCISIIVVMEINHL